jgi:tetratricopeptide (TPR) repeat protein
MFPNPANAVRQKIPENSENVPGMIDCSGCSKQRAWIEDFPNRHQERRMTKFAIRLLTLAMYAMALMAVPIVNAARAAGGDSPSPPATDTTKDKKKHKGSSIDDPRFIEGYRAAYATIYDRNDYPSAIEQLKALGQDDRADVANLIGYSYRKLGDYKVSQIWYERALEADPNHVRTWQYYGLWQLEQGNRDQAQYHLIRIGQICGTDCAEYRSLASALEKPTGTGLVY